MSVLLYRNICDKDMNSFFSIPNIIHTKKSDGLKIELFSNRVKKLMIDKIPLFDTLIFVTHGDKENLYHSYENDDPLISLENIDLLNKKKVIAISCATANILGKVACEGQCLVYLGMKYNIHRNIKNNVRDTTTNFVNLIDNIYKNAFSHVLLLALEDNYTFSKLKTIMEIELNKEVYKQNQIEKEKNLRQYNLCKLNFTIEAVTNVVDNIIIHGNEKLKIR